jgi:peptidoglycan/LPS O-acetylase OafA/YrhL
VLVLVHHFAGYQHPWIVPNLPVLFHVVMYCGPLGVKVFFVISGFVICRLLISEESRYGSVSLAAFYFRRIFRILPPLYIYLGAVSLLALFGLVHESRKSISHAALFLYDFEYLAPRGWIVRHTWSLAVEEQFYLIFPITWVLTPSRWRAGIFLGIVLLCVAWNVSIGYTGWLAIATSARQGFTCIACGVLIAIHEGRLRSIVSSVPGFIVAMVAITLLLHPAGAGSWGAELYESVLVPPAIGLVLLFSLGCGPWLRAFLCSKPVQAVGLTSYGIYLWQQLFTIPRTYQPAAGQGIGWLLPLLLVIVPLSYFLVEKPAMEYGKSLSRRILRRPRKSPINFEVTV